VLLVGNQHHVISPQIEAVCHQVDPLGGVARKDYLLFSGGIEESGNRHAGLVAVLGHLLGQPVHAAAAAGRGLEVIEPLSAAGFGRRCQNR